jgi:hypothetical protein
MAKASNIATFISLQGSEGRDMSDRPRYYVTVKTTGETHIVRRASGDEVETLCLKYFDRQARWDGTEKPRSILSFSEEPGSNLCKECECASACQKGSRSKAAPSSPTTFTA